jgi:hypothetical protein
VPGKLILKKYNSGCYNVFIESHAILKYSTERCTPSEDPFDPINAIPNDVMKNYYEQRSTAGLIVTEAIAVSEAGSGWLNAPQICTDEQAAGWKKITDRVHEAGSVI